MTNEFNLRVLKSVKAGNHVLCTHELPLPVDLLQEIISFCIPQPEEGSPRMIILCADNDSAVQLGAELAPFIKEKDLTLDLILEKGNKVKQRNDLFDGTEVIVGTSRRVCEMYFQNGYNISKMKMLIVLEMDKQMKKAWKGFISRMAESLPKVKQVLFVCDPIDERIDEYIDLYTAVHQRFISENNI